MAAEGKDNDMTLVTIGMIIFGIAVLSVFWHIKHDFIVWKVMQWRFYETMPFSLAGIPYAESLSQKYVEMASKPKEVSFMRMITQGGLSGYFYLPILIIFNAYFARKALTHPTVKSRRKLTADSLPIEMAKFFPAIIPVLKRDLTNDTSPEWAPSKQPADWAKEYGVLTPTGDYDEHRAIQVFEKQLGRKMTDFKSLAPHERTLMCIFLLKIYKTKVTVDGSEKEEWRVLCDAINRSAYNDKSMPDHQISVPYWQKIQANKTMARGLNQVLIDYQFFVPILAELLDRSRVSGVLPPQEFIWLKPTDRALWYALDTVGRKTPFVESAGFFAHWHAAKRLNESGYRLKRPFVKTASNGLKNDLIRTGQLSEKDAYANF